MKFEYTFSEIMGSLRRHLQYISGKRAVNVDFYFRHIACDADASFLYSIAEETLADISLRLGIMSGGYALKADLLTFTSGV